MLKRTLMTAFAVLGTTLSFANIHTASLLAAEPLVQDSPSNVLKITELLVNPQGTDDGFEYIEIKNTGPNSVTISSVYLVMIDNEDSQNGEVDFVLRLNQAGMPSSLASGEVLVIRDTVSGSAGVLSPTGGTPYDFNFTDALKNSGGSFFLVGGLQNIAYGDMLDTNEDDVLDFAATSGADTKEWTSTYDHVWFSRGLDADPSSTDISWEGGAFFPSSGSFDNLKADKQSTWTPDGLTRLQKSTGGWLNGLIYDVQTKNGSNQIPFDASGEYTWVKASEAGTTVGAAPFLVSGNTRVSQGLANGSQITVKKNSGATITYSH